MGNRSCATVRLWATALLVATGLGGVSGAAQATLMGRDLNGDTVIDAYYDDVLKITWLKNANYAATELSDARRDAIIANVGSVANTGGAPHTLTTSDFEKSGGIYTGRMTWWGAMAWAQDLLFGGYSDWRLAAINLTSPTLTAHDCSVGGAAACALSGDELGYMYYFDLDGVGNNTGTQTFGGATLDNIQSSYWSGTEINSNRAWDFVFLNGDQGDGLDSKGNLWSAWAVRDGDVVPEPTTLALLALGLAGLGFSRRRTSAQA